MLGVNIGTAQPREEGVEIMGVSPGGPAERAGLRIGDVILSVNGKSLKKSADKSPGTQLVEFMRSVEPGQVVKLEYQRAGKRQSAEVITNRAEPPFARVLRERMLLPLPEGIELPDFEEMLSPNRSFRSLELVPITPKLGQYFGTDKGLLVVRAPAEPGFQLQEGDVLMSIDGRTPDNPGHAFRILRSYQPGEKVKIGVLRNHKRLARGTKPPSGVDIGRASGRPCRRPPPPAKPGPVAGPRACRRRALIACGPCCAENSITSCRTT
jgi:S1-C subfamily serine protease